MFYRNDNLHFYSYYAYYNKKKEKYGITHAIKFILK